MYFVIDDNKLNSADGYSEYTASTATSVPWSGVTNKPESFIPSTHTHKKEEIIDFPTEMPASDVKDWAKADNKPTYNANEIKFDDGQTFQEKYNNGELKGQDGVIGHDGAPGE